jgi:hypothetical protein
MHRPSRNIFLGVENSSPQIKKSNFKSEIRRFLETGGFALISWIVIGVLSRLIFVSYMGYEGFFSYDFFSEGIFGLSVFFLISELILAFASILIGEKIPWQGWIFLAFNLLCLTFLAIFLSENTLSQDKFGVLLSGLSVCYFICLHLSHVLYGTFKTKIYTLAAVVVCVVFFSSIPQYGFSQIVSIGLRIFGSGGNIPVSVSYKDRASSNTTCGKLLLLAPNYVYLRDTNGSLRKIASDQVEIEIFKDVTKFKCDQSAL